MRRKPTPSSCDVWRCFVCATFVAFCVLDRLLGAVDERGVYFFERLLPLACGREVDPQDHAPGKEVSEKINFEMYVDRCSDVR